MKHVFRITATDEDYVPTGEFIEVGGTPFDLRTPQRLGDRIVNAGSIYHHNFCVLNYNEKVIHFSIGIRSFNFNDCM